MSRPYGKQDFMRGPIDVFDPSAPNYMGVVLLPEDELMQEYQDLLAEDPGIEQEALQAAKEMRLTPFDDLDSKPIEKARRTQQVAGKVGRRAPANPFHSPKLGKFRAGTGTTKVEDPALQNNPLRGRLIVNIAVNSALLLVFCQALIYNRLEVGKFYASQSENSNIGPAGLTLYDLGGLNANAIRQGEWIRMFWSPWMHSGWLHIGLNVLSQIQYFYMLEPDWGSLRTILLFWVSGITGNLLSCLCDPCKTTVGSSGGLFGLMGGIVPYSIEFWHSIPRPLCILIFSIVVLVISILTGLSAATDTWAHLGGLIGGILFGLGTITTPAAFLPKEKVLKKQLRKNAVMRWLQQTINPNCKCGLREWSIRLVAWALLAIVWIVCFLRLYTIYEYSPPGSLTYHGITKCCCCYDKSGRHGTGEGSVNETIGSERVRTNWVCMSCDYVGYPEDSTYPDWNAYCEAQQSGRRLLSELDNFVSMDSFLQEGSDTKWDAIDRAIAEYQFSDIPSNFDVRSTVKSVIAG
eukprot:Gregarina_sp_Poly_1__11245@NODE_929_length_5674_cov_208_795256_g660_i0_p1_GENE_NODE_929_length_5674_cov_208_795256_g660_i0NODE_929_length_5674_cov_208_795256_g660_i0_p1_ORF_typecomplete_len520_score34_15Rhomboid/PF01694_22/1_2e04Rhomboid/PF01694_22/7_9e29PIGP/PF08510_12/2_5e03PIGP/PF08510_12/0_044DUF1751/PF08551_10/0_037DUF1751/PF08551_10/4_1e03DUF1751/PF08551_10/1_1e04Tmemb_9/PF05434_11/1_8e04Tmemb_9/PF05434_11/0_38_NODE_929_length_5674_cov_208_795256_g660_i027484307